MWWYFEYQFETCLNSVNFVANFIVTEIILPSSISFNFVKPYFTKFGWFWKKTLLKNIVSMHVRVIFAPHERILKGLITLDQVGLGLSSLVHAFFLYIGVHAAARKTDENRHSSVKICRKWKLYNLKFSYFSSNTWRTF